MDLDPPRKFSEALLIFIDYIQVNLYRKVKISFRAGSWSHATAIRGWEENKIFILINPCTWIHVQEFKLLEFLIEIHM